MDSLDDDAMNWEFAGEKDTEPNKKRKKSEKPAELGVYRPKYHRGEEGELTFKKKYSFPYEDGSDSELMFLEDDFQGTIFHTHVKNRFERKFKEPSILYAHILRYFAAVDADPVYRNEILKSGLDAGKIVGVPTKRPYMIEGLRIFLGLSKAAYEKYKSDPDFEEFHLVIEQAELIIYNDQMTGAMVGYFNPNIVAKKNGLVEKTESKVDVEAKYIITGMEIF